MKETNFLTVNVNDKTEKKNGLTYLSWAWAWQEVLKVDPNATWEAVEYNGLPCAYFADKTAMVKTLVTINGVTKSCLLPVMDHKNKAIPNPNAFDINKAIVRCMTKAVSMFGLGLYIYAGEDMPEESIPPVSKEQAEEIGRLIEATKTNKPSFLEWVSKETGLRVAEIDEIPSNWAEYILTQLKKKLVKAA